MGTKNENAYVRLNNINKKYKNFKASDNISFDIEKGKLVALLGPSGSGKTTILKIISGLENSDSGEIYIDGKQVNNVKPKDRGIGMVFQNYALFRYKTVYDNIAFGLKIQKKDKAFINDKVNKLIELVGLKGMEKRYPTQLSGGQRQRVAFARAIATQPQLLLLDEPFAAIDAKVRKELRNWLRELIDEVGITSIFVTHDQEEAIELADTIILTNNGKIEQIGTPRELYDNPKTAFAAGFFGENVKLDGIDSCRLFKGFNNIKTGDGAYVRPEYVSVYSDSDVIQPEASVEQGVVKNVVFKGNIAEAEIVVNNIALKAYRQVSQKLIKRGDKVKVFIEKMLVTDKNNVRIEYNELYRTNNSVVI